MKKNIIKSLGLIFALGFLASCDKEAEVTRLSVINFPQTFKSSANEVVVTKDNGDSEVATFNWDAVSYGIKGAVTYSLQFVLPSDTTGATAWSKATEMVVGDDILTKTITATELNDIAINALGLEAGAPVKVAVRVKSYVDRPAYSNAITLNVTPYTPPVVIPTLPSLWVLGDFQGWNGASAPTIVSANSDGLYEGYVYIPAGGTYHLKYANQPDLTHIVYGDGGAGALSTEATAADIVLPSDGYYELSANLNTMTWKATKTTWSVIGDATPGGWTTDTPMTYDPTLKVWTVTCEMLSTGSFKFRANNAWAIDFGVDAAGKLKYADNPLYPYDGTLLNLTVPTSGNYTITLDLHVPGAYTYKLKKN
jgi:hypothetical protein